MSVMSMPLGEGAISAHPDQDQQAKPLRMPPSTRRITAKADMNTLPEPR